MGVNSTLSELLSQMKNTDFISFVKKAVVCMAVILSGAIPISSTAQTCCPEFKIKDAVEICAPEGACEKEGGNLGNITQDIFVACKESTHVYTVYPNDPVYTYSWTIVGGNMISANPGNPVVVKWGSGSSGFIKVVISGINGCVDSLLVQICLIDKPKAGFITSADTVCTDTPVYFTNISSGGAISHWQFGDGNTSDDFNAVHSYSAPGIYTVLLTVTDFGGGSDNADEKSVCGCSDTISKTIVVLAGKGPRIDTDCCFGTACPNEVHKFCTPDTCSSYIWSVMGGTIISGQGTMCVQVMWDQINNIPTTVTLETPNCGASPCPAITTLHVPVLYPDMPVNGPGFLCVGASGNFSLPHLPGTYYNWTVTGGVYTVGDFDQNVSNINVTFNSPGYFTISCSYNNPLSGCSGLSVINVVVLPSFDIIYGADIVCENDTELYGANSMALWSVYPAGAIVPAGIFNPCPVTWTTPGTYVLKAVNSTPGSFCNDTAYKVVEVVAKPVLSAISGPAFACSNKNFTFSVTSNVDDSPFIWSVSPGTGIIHSVLGEDGDQAIIELSGAGPWTINVYQQVELTPGKYCNSTIQSLTVNPYPQPIISGTGTVCVDGIETYTTALPVPPGGFQWSVSPPNRGTILSGQGSDQVTVRWHGTPANANIIVSSCAGNDAMPVTIVNPPLVSPIIANGPTAYCLPDVPNNLLLSIISGYPGYQWYHNGNPIPFANSSNYLITTLPPSPALHAFSVVVSTGVCEVTKTIHVLIDNCPGGQLPVLPPCILDFTFSPNPACVDQPVSFTAIPSFTGFDFTWDFGDGSTSFTKYTEHSYSAPGIYNVTLVGTFPNLCTLTVVKQVIVNPLPSCVINTTNTIFCPGDSVLIKACSGMSGYQWFRDGILIPGAVSSDYYAKQHGEYYVLATNNFGCSDKSNDIYIYMHGLPKAKIKAQRTHCSYPGSWMQLNLSAFYDTVYSYSWSDVPGGATFSANNNNLAYNTLATITLPVVLPYQHQFVLEVTDITTGCSNYDTVCVTFYEIPPLNFNWQSACEGNSLTFVPTPNDPSKYDYMWSTGASTPTITASAAGSYSLTITNKITGCSAYGVAGVIFPKPDVSHFPLGCKTIQCNDTLNMYVPLPLNSQSWNNTYPSNYPLIEWYDQNNSLVGTGQTLPFVSSVSGDHELMVMVQNIFGCVNTAGVFCITVECVDPEGLDFGDAPDRGQNGCYPTLLINNGARHQIVQGVYLGNMVDPEPDGQPNVSATGDDNDILFPSLGDDEDGVILPTVISPGQTVAALVTASTDGYLDVWIDFNINCSWADPNEHVLVTHPLYQGINDIVFDVPCDAAMGRTYARFRFRTDNLPISFDGYWPNGEVEDYVLYIEGEPCGQYDFGDAPENSLAYLPSTIGNFPTCVNVGPANSFIRHSGNKEAFFGETVDYESDGNAGWCPSFNPFNYDMDECFSDGFNDGDAGLIMPQAYSITTNATEMVVVPCTDLGPDPLWRTCHVANWGQNIDITVTNNLPGQIPAYVNLLVDWDQDGNWGGSSMCGNQWNVPEHALVNFVVPSGFSGALSSLTPPNFQIGSKSGYVWARFSITETPVSAYWDGSGTFAYGETEDYMLKITRSTIVVHDTIVLGPVNIPPWVDTCVAAIKTIIVGGQDIFQVESGGSINLEAGEQIRMLQGTQIYEGAYMRARIISDDMFCLNYRSDFVNGDDVSDSENEPLIKAGNSIFRVYPNPTSGILNIDMSASNPETDFIIEVFNIIGEKIVSQSITGNGLYEINMTEYNNGLYFICVKSESAIKIEKFMKL